jgi:hypothetical protein
MAIAQRLGRSGPVQVDVETANEGFPVMDESARIRLQHSSSRRRRVVVFRDPATINGNYNRHAEYYHY